MKRYWLTEARINKGLTQRELAKQLDLEPSWYCLVEKRERNKNLPLPLAVKLAKILGLTLDEIAKKEGL